ncbi:glycosyltransferase [Aestuariicoccus sp. MJ-SS9]|uniref:glycosyltransferase n=1 Tax=Aestuariicoccus sp. MJ-SS9 TaxID=3079855 RepID=UPI002909D4B8|nr:glycosyltransferase [Aestuariicoccus sp. MJ-SS9]MDU8914003.1 glycosyltransferase [Aestuariicoccus sp. MJ-SS9]
MSTTDPASNFWTAVAECRKAFWKDDAEVAQRHFKVATHLASASPGPDNDNARQRKINVLQQLARVYKLDLPELSNVAKNTAHFAGRYDFYPNLSGRRQAEGGLRLRGHFKCNRPDAPLVTIVTAIYDNHDSFQRCIDSVRAQTYPNVEYIVVDGNSPQETLDILRANEDFIDYYVSEPDKGIYSAMNKGIELARGDYICLLNSDDFYDPDFVTETLRVARSDPDQRADIVYTDYHVGSKLLVAQQIDAGLLFGHLHVCHNTFLVHRSCYDRIGPYDEDFRIVSDAVWMRKAFREGAVFRCLNKPLFTLIEGGLSSGGTEARRKLFISEAARSYQLHFPRLNTGDAEEIYLFRFNKMRVKALTEIARRHIADKPLIRALRGYVEHCLRDRENFRLAATEVPRFFEDYCALIDLLDADMRCIQLETKLGPLSDILGRIDAVAARRKPEAARTILHFVSVFSAPPETFIYDLVQRLEARSEYDNFVLFEHPQLRAERPYGKAIMIHWADFDHQVGERLYKYLVDRIRPDVVIGHFALNEWKWAQRIDALDLDIPTISMCHGIDVFSMRTSPDYKDYIVKDFAERRNTAFTAVSKYLVSELYAHGVPSEKINLVYNTINPRFFKFRKKSGFYDGTRTLQLLSVGRLVRWKGHEYLLRGLAEFCATCTQDVHLTVVYGNGADRLEALQELAQKLGIQDKVTFEPFINFAEQPEYYTNFDCFVFPSTYSEDELQRSETFGLAILEAIAAGLPVISSDAGGLPEVIGDETPFARIVPHGDGAAIATALADMWRKGTAFADNIGYATERLAVFSEERQGALLDAVIERVTVKPVDVALFSSSTVQGAGYAAFRLHKGLRNTDIRSHLFTTVPNHGDEPDVTVVPHPSGNVRNWNVLQLPPKPGLTIMSLSQTHIPSEDLLRMVEPYDVINLHWYARFLSTENIASLTWSDKPVVMTIRDMLPLTGGCHCFHGCDKWQADCSDCPQIDSVYRNYPAQLLAEKRAHYNFDNLTLVTLSQHTRNIVAQAPYFRDCRVETIPNSIELDVFRPYDKMNRRKDLGLPLDRPIIGYVPSYSSEIKGYRELVEAFGHLKQIDPALNPFVMLVGGKTPATDQIAFDKKALGYISDKKRLAWAYAAADVIVVPSLEETFSNTAAEALSCGTPVVGFKTGAIPDLAIDGETGHTSEIGDAAGLARGLSQVLRGPNLGKNCRHRAERLLSFMTQAHLYEALFKDLLQQRKTSPDRAPRIFNSFDRSGVTLAQIAAESLLRSKS